MLPAHYPDYVLFVLFRRKDLAVVSVKAVVSTVKRCMVACSDSSYAVAKKLLGAHCTGTH